MSTTIRPEISKKKKYWISCHRYYELRHYCLQYPEWIREMVEIKLMPESGLPVISQPEWSDPTGDKAVRYAELNSKIQLIRDLANEADPIIGIYILEGVTTGRGFAAMNAEYDIPCSKDYYYDKYRKFFYLLHLAK